VWQTEGRSAFKCKVGCQYLMSNRIAPSLYLAFRNAASASRRRDRFDKLCHVDEEADVAECVCV